LRWDSPERNLYTGTEFLEEHTAEQEGVPKQPLKTFKGCVFISCIEGHAPASPMRYAAQLLALFPTMMWHPFSAYWAKPAQNHILPGTQIMKRPKCWAGIIL
jgi:hypothetical protein